MAHESAPDPALLEDLVVANRILYDQGVLDGFGHVSARHDKNPAHFLISQHRTPAAVTTADIMALDLEGNATDNSGRKLTLERFIHSEIYKARPDVMAIVHSHSPAVIPYGVTRTPLRPVWHVSAFLGTTDIPVFEIRDVAGPATDLLIRTPYLGHALARSLKQAPVVLMRGHGSTTVGASVKQAVYRAVYTELNARLQFEAMQMGEVNFLTSEEAATAAPFMDGELSISKPWELWLQRVRAAEKSS
jgi:ribulose-5-phosphate 4-epimerase/fuculose-1-phosphate aldolase